jgi:hypothetical protein
VVAHPRKQSISTRRTGVALANKYLLWASVKASGAAARDAVLNSDEYADEYGEAYADKDADERRAPAKCCAIRAAAALEVNEARSQGA